MSWNADAALSETFVEDGGATIWDNDTTLWDGGLTQWDVGVQLSAAWPKDAALTSVWS